MSLDDELEKVAKGIDHRKQDIQAEILELKSNIKRYSQWAWAFVYIGIVVAFIGIWSFVLKKENPEFELNLLGDFLGGSVASIWSLAGLFFIYVAFLGQKQQLLQQQLELMYSQLEVKYTRLELSEQKEELRIQNDTLKQQRFENTFFQLLTLLNSIVNSLDVLDMDTLGYQAKGRDCFQIFYNELINISKKKKNNENAEIDDILTAYSELYERQKSELSHYFRTIYHIYKFIDKSTIKDKATYASITRAQLSSYEQILIFYNCLHKNGKEKFKPLIEKYTVFKNIDRNLLLNLEHVSGYKAIAFKRHH